jgi:mRNA interferase HigB
MRLITEPRIREYARLHPLAGASLTRWREIVKAAEWKSFQDLKKAWKSADVVRVSSARTVVVFNIGGNNFRLIAAVHYNLQKVYVLGFYTHQEYSKDDWKRDL